MMQGWNLYQHVYNIETSRYGICVHLHGFKLKSNKDKYDRDDNYTIWS